MNMGARTMNRGGIFSIIIGVTLFSAACDRETTVQAASEPSPVNQARTVGHSATGELRSVDVARNTFIVRLANGIEQTFIFDDATRVNGAVPGARKGQRAGISQIKDLARKGGSLVRVQWQDPTVPQLATALDLN